MKTLKAGIFLSSILFSLVLFTSKSNTMKANNIWPTQPNPFGIFLPVPCINADGNTYAAGNACTLGKGNCRPNLCPEFIQ